MGMCRLRGQRYTASLKEHKWRKSIYRKIGTLNIADMAGAKRILERRHGQNRVAVSGLGGGGSSTLNLMFQLSGKF
jgi:dipeptidyl-peptidase-4